MNNCNVYIVFINNIANIPQTPPWKNPGSAPVDHNYNTQCQQATTKSGLFITIPCKIVLHAFYFLTGKARFKLLFPKGRKAWVVKPILESKKYIHLTYMLDDIVQLRLHGDKLDTMTFDKPSTLPHNIATVDKLRT